MSIVPTLNSLINDRGTFIFLGFFSVQDTLIRDRTFNIFSIFSAQDYYKEPYLLLEALHAIWFIRNVVPVCLVLILHFCTVVSYFQWNNITHDFYKIPGTFIFSEYFSVPDTLIRDRTLINFDVLSRLDVYWWQVVN